MKRDNKSVSPATSTTLPPAPAWLSPTAREEWNRLAPILVAEGRLLPAQETAFGSYCVAVGNMLNASSAIGRDGITIEGRRGGIVKHPACTILNAAMSQVLQYGKIFGLSPASRAALDKVAPVAIRKPSRFDNL